MSRIVDWVNKPKTVLMIFGNFPRLKQWLELHKEQIIKSGGEIRLITTTVTWTNGSRLILGHAVDDEDFDKFKGLEYDVVIGGNEDLRRRALVNRTLKSMPDWRNGRRTGLKILCPKGRMGSTPVSGTKIL
jgi:hypothetical protein